MWAPSVRGNKPAHSCGPLFFSHQIDLCSVAHRPPKEMSDLIMRQENNPFQVLDDWYNTWVCFIKFSAQFPPLINPPLCVLCVCLGTSKETEYRRWIMGPTSSSVQSCAGTTYAELAEGEGTWIPIFGNSPSHVICDGWKPFFHYSNEMTSSSLSLSLLADVFNIFQTDGFGCQKKPKHGLFYMGSCFMIVVLQ